MALECSHCGADYRRESCAPSCPNAKPSLRVLVAYHGPLDGAEFEFPLGEAPREGDVLSILESLYLVHQGRLEHVVVAEVPGAESFEGWKS